MAKRVVLDFILMGVIFVYGFVNGLTLGSAFNGYCSRQTRRALDWIEHKFFAVK